MAVVERWRNHLAESADFQDAAWAKTGSPTLADATSPIPGETATQYTNDGAGGGRSVAQASGIGTLTTSPETSSLTVKNVDAVITGLELNELGVGTVCRIRHTWATGVTSLVSAANGSNESYGAVDLGEDWFRLWMVVTPDNSGSTRRFFVYPTGTTTNAETVILGHAHHGPGSTYAPAMIVTGASAKTVRTLDLDQLGVQAPVKARHLALAQYTPRADGTVGQSTHGPAASSRVWPIETSPFLTAATAVAVERELRAPGYLHATGVALHRIPGVAFECEARNVRRLAGLDSDTWQITFDLHERQAAL